MNSNLVEIEKLLSPMKKWQIMEQQNQQKSKLNSDIVFDYSYQDQTQVQKHN